MADDRVARLHGLLVEELKRRGRPESEPVPLAELYQELVPYAAVRSRLGFELNADYEDTLLRLLAGVGGRVHVEPEEARQELVRELEAPYPDVGAFRKFASSRVWVEHEGAVPVPPADAQAGADADMDMDGPSDGASDGASDAEAVLSPADADAVRAPADRRPAGREGAERGPIRLHTDVGAGSDTEADATLESDGPFVPRGGMACRFCSHALPAGRRVRFCPFCGGDQRARPCPRCDAVLEPGWRYCIRCGLDLPDRAPDRVP